MLRHGTRNARALRSRMTDAERCLWRHLRAARLTNTRFKRQQSLGPYIVDFVSFHAKVVVEFDGGLHAESTTDPVRDAWLARQGFRILRFWNNEVLNNTEAVLERIAQHLDRTPAPRSRKRSGA
ncbi:MAG TPA: DUF559 domain-containing protein [Burkholderiales bacterium]|nr:DUF559 domain-containing protein [Burkholderiales bacterium]